VLLGEGQKVIAVGGVGVVLAQGLAADGQGLAVALLRLGVAPQLMFQDRQLGVTEGRPGVILPQHLAPGRQRPPAEWFRLLEPALERDGARLTVKAADLREVRLRLLALPQRTA